MQIKFPSKGAISRRSPLEVEPPPAQKKGPSPPPPLFRFAGLLSGGVMRAKDFFCQGVGGRPRLIMEWPFIFLSFEYLSIFSSSPLVPLADPLIGGGGAKWTHKSPKGLLLLLLFPLFGQSPNFRREIPSPLYRSYRPYRGRPCTCLPSTSVSPLAPSQNFFSPFPFRSLRPFPSPANQVLV